MPEPFRSKHLQEMVLVSQAVYDAFHPEKLNYEVLGNGDSHIHWHLFPRITGDIPMRGPVWLLPPEEMFSESKKPSAEELKSMIDLLKSHIDQQMK